AVVAGHGHEGVRPGRKGQRLAAEDFGQDGGHVLWAVGGDGGVEDHRSRLSGTDSRKRGAVGEAKAPPVTASSMRAGPAMDQAPSRAALRSLAMASEAARPASSPERSQ